MTQTPDRPKGNPDRELARLREENESLRRQLAGARLRAANYLAAIRAAISAEEDGEWNPVEYLRLELEDDAGGAHGA
jgi:hypothetical protein